MSSTRKIILPYRLSLTIPAASFAVTALVLLVVSVAASYAFLVPLSVALLISAAAIMIQNKRILLENNIITVQHFFGIVKDIRITPVECGLFVSDSMPLQKPVYLDRRVIRTGISPNSRKYIYISEYVLSKEEQEGSQYIHGEPILILPYSKELYSALVKAFEFNCEPFAE